MTIINFVNYTHFGDHDTNRTQKERERERESPFMHKVVVGVSVDRRCGWMILSVCYVSGPRSE